MVDYIIRPMKEEDIPQVAKIDREAFPGEWRSHTSYRRDMSNPVAHYIVACRESKAETELRQQGRPELPWFKRLFSHNYLPAEERYTPSAKNILGFVGLWIMFYEAHIIAIAVRNDYRRTGIGEELLFSTIELAAQLNAKVVTLEVRASNKAAQALYKKCGFQLIGRRAKYYSDNGEDAVLMGVDNITSAPFQTRFQQLKEAHRQRWGRPSTTQIT